MKKIIYLAPALLLGLVGKGAMADQTMHISHLDTGFMTSLNEPQLDQAANANKPEQEYVAQNKDVKTGEANETKKATTHISSLDSGIIEDNAKTNETNEVKHTTATNINSLDNNIVENNAKAVRYNNFSVRTNTETASNFIESKVANGDSNQHTINNPNNDQIIIHYVDEHGATIAGLKDYTIDINNAPKGNSTGQFKVPDNRYVLPDPTSDYQLQHDKHKIHHDAVWGTRIGTYWDGSYTVYNMNTGEEIEQFRPNPYTPGWYSDTTVPDQYDNLNGIPVREAPNLEQRDGEPYIVKQAYTETVGDDVFSDNSKNIKSVIGNTVNVILKHGTRHIIDPGQTGLSNDATNNVFVINNGAKRQINSQSRHFGASGVLDLVTNKITKQGDWLLLGKSNFDQTNINNDLVGYGDAIHSNLTFLAL